MTRQNTAPVEDTPADPEPEPETEEQNLETKEEEEENYCPEERTTKEAATASTRSRQEKRF